MKEILDLRLYTVSETADLLATNAAAVRRYIKAGTLRAAKIGGVQMITEGAIKDYLSGVTAQPQSAESYLNAASQPLYKAKKGEKEQPKAYRDWETDRKSTRLNSSHRSLSRMPSSA